MTDDGLRGLIDAAAASAPEPRDLWAGAERRAALIRRRRTRAAAYGGTVLATVAVLAVGAGIRPDGPVTADAPPTAATAPANPAPASPSLPGAPTPGPGSGTAPRPPAGPFGAPVVTDSFDGSLDPTRWVAYAEGTNSAYARWSAEDVAVRDGSLRLTARRSGNGYPPYTTGGVGGVPMAREYGRYTVRLRVTAGPSVIGQVVLAPMAGSAAPITALSLGTDRRRATLAEGSAPPRVVTLPAPVTTDRTLVVEWTPAQVRWTLDGAEFGRSTALRGPYFLALQFIVVDADCGATPLPPSCPERVALPQVMEVRSVTIQPYTGR